MVQLFLADIGTCYVAITTEKENKFQSILKQAFWIFFSSQVLRVSACCFSNKTKQDGYTFLKVYVYEDCSVVAASISWIYHNNELSD